MVWDPNRQSFSVVDEFGKVLMMGDDNATDQMIAWVKHYGLVDHLQLAAKDTDEVSSPKEKFLKWSPFAVHGVMNENFHVAAE
jgi:hypothetical protein